jgi:hypothetical protein
MVHTDALLEIVVTNALTIAYYTIEFGNPLIVSMALKIFSYRVSHKKW